MKPSINLIKETKDLLLKIKRNYIAISVNVFKMKSAQEWNEKDWVDFYEQELELEKSQVSKFLKVGQFVLEQSCFKTTAGYQQLYLSINRNKDKEPAYVLAEAETWKKSDYRDAKKDECDHNYPKVLVCSKCWARINTKPI